MEFRLGQHLQQAREQRRVAAGLAPSKPPKPPKLSVVEEPQAGGLMPVTQDPQSPVDAEPATPKRRFGDRAMPRWLGPTNEPALPTRLPSRLPSQAAAPKPAPIIEPTAEPVPSKAPTLDRCLNCQGTVRVDMFDLVAGCAYLTCVDCGFGYTAKSPRSADAPVDRPGRPAWRID